MREKELDGALQFPGNELLDRASALALDMNRVLILPKKSRGRAARSDHAGPTQFQWASRFQSSGE